MITRRVDGDKAVITFDTEFTIHEVKEIKQILKEVEEDKIINLVFDISTVKYIDSSAIGMLVTVLKYTKKNKGYFKLYSPTEEVSRILKLVNLYSFFEIVDRI